MTRFLLGITVAVLLLSAARGDEPAPAETLPAPRALPAPAVVPVVPEYVYYRTSRYQVWQYYGINQFGYYRPRVAYHPYGSYYMYNGAPFPFEQNRLHEWQPHTAGTPYRNPDWPPVYMPHVVD